MAEPPMARGGCKETESCESPGVMPRIVGAPGGPEDGVPDVVEEAVVAAPGPAWFTARNATVYERLFDTPITAIGEDVEAGVRVIQVNPASSEYS
jgi:hypothetical protein